MSSTDEMAIRHVVQVLPGAWQLAIDANRSRVSPGVWIVNHVLRPWAAGRVVSVCASVYRSSGAKPGRGYHTMSVPNDVWVAMTRVGPSPARVSRWASENIIGPWYFGQQPLVAAAGRPSPGFAVGSGRVRELEAALGTVQAGDVSVEAYTAMKAQVAELEAEVGEFRTRALARTGVGGLTPEKARILDLVEGLVRAEREIVEAENEMLRAKLAAIRAAI